MAPRDEEEAPDPQYEGEDVRLTSRKELAGWYSYGFAAEVFVVCAMASFLPITLEQLARDQGVLLKDRTTPCKASWEHLTADSSAISSFVSTLSKPKELPACVVNFVGIEINTASFAMYTFSLSVLVQALLIISMSGAADHGRFRKTFLLGFAFTGSVSLMLFLVVLPKIYLLGALLAIISNTAFGASFVLLNSFLPLLVRHHPSMQFGHDSQEIYSSVDESQDVVDTPADFLTETEPLLSANPLQRASPVTISPELKLSTRISSNGVAIGYLAGLLVQCIAIGIVVATGSTTFSLRLVLFIIGLWWLCFSIPAALWLRPRPGPPLPESKEGSWSYIGYAWASLYKTIKKARRLRDMLVFLIAWFLVSDGIATVSGTAILFAKTTLGMKTEALALISVIGTIAGIIGALYWSWFSRLFDLKASQTIVACICLFEVIPLYGLLAYFPAIRNLGVFGLQQSWEMYPLGAIYGFVLGGLSSYCRSFFGELIPPGFEAAFYALFAITDKGSSVFGPAIVGAITDRYGEIRPAFLFLAVLLAMPLPLMLLVDVDRGKAHAAELALELEGKKSPGHTGQYEAIPRITVDAEHED